MQHKGAMILLSLAILLILTDQSHADPEWGYHGNKGPDHWSKIFTRYCSGRRQSPIDFSREESEYDSSLAHYIFNVPNLTTTANYTVFNDGHIIRINLDKADFKVGVGNGPDVCFRPNELHFHWGSSDTTGSEHWVNNRQYAMEAHLVTWDCQFYKNRLQALTGIDGLAVFGFFYEVVKDAPNDTILQSIIDTFSKPHVQECDTCLNDSANHVKEPILPFDISKLVPADRYNFWQYYGSLTTPDCRENVRWTVYNSPKPIPSHQMEAFRKLKYHTENGISIPMVNSFRNVKRLNPYYPPGPQRKLTRSFKVASDFQEETKIGVKKSGPKAFLSTSMVIACVLLLITRE